MNPEEPPSTRLPLREKIGYGLGDAASNLFFQFINLFLFYYYTDVFGLAPATAGTLFLVARLWDALSDPLMGALADRTTSRHGRYRPYLLWMAVPFGIIGCATFANPGFGETGKLVYASATYLLLMTVYTAINVPYSALMGVMTPSPEERTTLSTYRFLGAFSGMLIVSLSVRPLVRWLGGGDEALGFKLTMAWLSAIAVVFFLITFATTRERIRPAEGKAPGLKRDLLFLFKSRPWGVMVIAAVFTLAQVALRGGVTNHFFKYYAGDDGSTVFWFLDRTSLVLTTGAIAFIAGIFFTGWPGRRFGKRNALVALTLLNAAAMAAFYFIPADAYGTMVAVNALGSLIAGPTPALVWSIYSDVADYGEWRFGRRSTALAFATIMFAHKIGLTLGGWACGWLLEWSGFVANTAQSATALHGIRLMFTVLPGALALLGGIVLFWYPLTDAMVRKIGADLAARRGHRAAGTQTAGNVNVLGLVEALAQAGGQPLGAIRPDLPERDLHRGQRGQVGARLDPVEAGHRHLLGHLQAMLLESGHQIVGLVIGGADPRRHPVAATVRRRADAFFHRQFRLGKDPDHILRIHRQLQPRHLLQEGPVAPERPARLDRIGPRVKSDPPVAGGGQVVDQHRDPLVVIDVDAVDRPVLVLVHQRDQRAGGSQLVDDAAGKGIDQQHAPGLAAGDPADAVEHRVLDALHLRRDEDHLQLRAVKLAIFRDPFKDLRPGALVAAVEVLLRVRANQHAEVHRDFRGLLAAQPGLHVGVAELRGDLEDLGPRHRADAGVIGEATRHRGPGNPEPFRDQLLVHFRHDDTPRHRVGAE